ncbi:MAG: twin-arginine translocase TatA/TatE family subunit [Dehalococcoidia bacterium]|nr:MAG: twin-arginine translocase TatA/TatE family subunit [Dehalococcoidia bacterium]
MDFFGIGPFEILLILLVAFIVVGPQRLLEVSRKVGTTVSDLSRSMSRLNETVQKEMKEKTSPNASNVKDTNQSDRQDKQQS